MRSDRTLPFVLSILDDGLRVYRRHFVGFVLLASVTMLMLALGGTAAGIVIRSQARSDGATARLASIATMLGGYLIVLYLFAGISRATAAAIDGTDVTMRGALRVALHRSLGMLAFGVWFSLLPTIVVWLATTLIVRESHGFIFSVVWPVLIRLGVRSSTALTLMRLITHELYYLTLPSIWLACSVLVVQAFVLESYPWAVAVQRCAAMLRLHVGRSLLLMAGIAALFTTLGLTYFGSMLVLAERIGDLSRTQRLPLLLGSRASLGMAVASLTILLPPLSIWMTLFYRRTAAEYDGDDLAQRITTWNVRPHLHAREAGA